VSSSVVGVLDLDGVAVEGRTLRSGARCGERATTADLGLSGLRRAGAGAVAVAGAGAGAGAASRSAVARSSASVVNTNEFPVISITGIGCLVSPDADCGGAAAGWTAAGAATLCLEGFGEDAAEGFTEGVAEGVAEGAGEGAAEPPARAALNLANISATAAAALSASASFDADCEETAAGWTVTGAGADDALLELPTSGVVGL
jgi:hypothetical protein